MWTLLAIVSEERRPMNRLTLLLPIAVAACSLTPAQQASVATSVATLASVAASQNKTAASLLAEGALVCGQVNSATGQLLIASAEIIADGAGIPVSVTGQTAAAVAAACPKGMVPGPLPAAADPATVPVVPTGSALPTVS